MNFERWYEDLKRESKKRLGLDFEAEFDSVDVRGEFASGESASSVIDRLIERFDLDDLSPQRTDQLWWGSLDD